MATHQFTTRIQRSPDIVFATIADLSNYHTWLSESSSFSATTEVTPLPVGLGTTYVDRGKSGKRYGSVTEFDPPAHIAFHQPMKLPLGGAIDINVRYTLEEIDGATNVLRDITLDYQVGPLGAVLEKALLPIFFRENQRVLDALKNHIETS